ncbi:hypothetical protein F5877DRAFT_85199 [Lentinula edodes]|nr:hypothetical protein F5877DRAFT_85199 [Lentinula edodes]
MGSKRATASTHPARRSIVWAPSASYAGRHRMITRSKTSRASETDALMTIPLSSISAAEDSSSNLGSNRPSAATLLFSSIASAIATRNDNPNSPPLSSVSVANATANTDPKVVSPLGSASAPTSSFVANPVLPHVALSDDDCDDNFHGEVRTYLDYTSDLLNAQAEEVKLLRREVASARKEKAALEQQHEEDVAARKEEYQCPICYELLWDPYVCVLFEYPHLVFS